MGPNDKDNSGARFQREVDKLFFPQTDEPEEDDDSEEKASDDDKDAP